MRFFFIAILSFMLTELQATGVDYRLSIEHPNSHCAQVDIILSDISTKTVELKMPVWTPGSYMVREFEKNIDRVIIQSGKGNIVKKDKNTWVVDPQGQKSITISYPVYCFEPTVRTSYIDNDHAFLLLSSCLMYVNGYNGGGQITLSHPAAWAKVSTTLESKGNASYTYTTYDELVDSPIEIGNHSEISFDIAGVPHKVAMVGRNNSNAETFKKDITKVCETMYNIIGAHPCKSYLFIVHHVEEGGGGLEHANSCVVQMPRFNYSNPDRYKAFLGLLAHEYFHLWNVKRIRPAALGPFDYSKENYTNLLWVAEGITSYYDELAMYRAGFISESDYLKALASTFTATLNRKGGEVQSMHEASFDAWIKEYRPTENSTNNTISYYLKGSALAALLDIELLSATNGEKGLDKLMQYLYNEYYIKQNRGFKDEEFYAAIDKIAGKALNFKEWATGLNDASTMEKLAVVMKKAACTLKNKETSNLNFTGITTEQKGDKLMIRWVEFNSPAWQAGLQAGDELLAINDIRVKNSFDETLKNSAAPYNVLISRAGLIRTINLTTQKSPKYDLQLSIDKGDDVILKAWLKK
jgi:predicted metalloprotease with PDZ domain